MVESGEMRTKAGARVTTENPNQESANNSSGSREEGELSSSDNDELRTGSVSEFTANTAARAEPVQVPSDNKSPQAKGVKKGNSISTDNHTRFANVTSRTTVQPNYCKNSEKSRGPFVPFVISFSDDDSGSDSEECKQGKAIETKGNSLGVDGNGRPPASSLVKSQMLRKTTRNEIKAMPRKPSLSHSFVSSTTKFHGASRIDDPPLVRQRSRFRSFNIHSKKSASWDHGGGRNIHLTSSKLQDLRQQIAIQESKIKLKSTQPNKETSSEPSRECNVMKLKNDITMQCSGNSADIVPFEPKEPDKKRLKLSAPLSKLFTPDGQQEMPAARSTLASENSVLENCIRHNMDDYINRDKEIPLGTLRSSLAQWQKQDCGQDLVSYGNLPSGVKEGTNIITNGNQSDRKSKLVGSSSLPEQTARIANSNVRTSSRKLGIVDLKCSSELACHHAPSSFPKKVTCGHNLTRSSVGHEIRSAAEAFEQTSGDTHQAYSLHVPDSNLETSDVFPNNPSLGNCLGKVNVSGDCNMDIQSLLGIEELQDKELEEAQEWRYKCEIEERNALKAYRKAQRALIEANARCSYLYRKRELYSAHFRSLMMENSSLLHNHVGARLNFSNNMPEVDMHLAPASSHQMEAEFDVHNQQGYCSNIQSVNDDPENAPVLPLDQQNLVSDPCSEPDASSSEPRKDNGVTNGVCSPSNDFGILGDENEGTSVFDHKSIQSKPGYQRREEISEEKENINDVSKGKFSIDNAQDSLLLEASLRSQLFARLEMKPSKNRDSIHSMVPAIGGTKNDGIQEKKCGVLPFEAEKDQNSNLEGTEEERNRFEHPVQIDSHCHVEQVSSDYAALSTADPLNRLISTEGDQSTRSLAFSCPILRSAFSHMRFIDSINLDRLQDGNFQVHPYDICLEKVSGVGLCENMRNVMSLDLLDKGALKDGSYSCNVAIDPFWPLCMYELRGKCNNDECSWQHVRDYSSKNVNHDTSDSADCEFGSSSQSGNHDQSFGPNWPKCYSTSLVVSSLLGANLPSYEPFLPSAEDHAEAYASWNKQSLFFRSRNGTVGKLDQHMADSAQSLEMALLYLNQETNKCRGRAEALKVLARALEAEPTSTVLWIVYLQVYYIDEKSIGKDDMFLCAVRHNEGSYELWLMYINSRMQLNDRLVAYDTALSALCRHASAFDRDPMRTSACILDLFLQMLDFMCISGNVSEAIKKTHGLIRTNKNSDHADSILLSDILPFLTISDKCIFWICCVYLVIYKKLPNVIIQKFEWDKELPAMGWPSAHLTGDERQHAVALMEMAVDSLALYIDRESLGSESTLRAAHLFAVNHIRCIAVLDGLECSRNLLEKYAKVYPSCLELVLMSARAQDQYSGDSSFVGFEEALTSWPEEIPGVQCIWNQYAEFALQKGKFDFVKQLLDRWFHCIWKVQFSQNGSLTTSSNGKHSLVLLESATASNCGSWISDSNQIDILFGLLNFSLYKLLQNDQFESRLAIDKALRVAATEHYEHCVREHAMLLLMDGLKFKEDAPTTGILSILNGYLIHVRASSASDPLSRMFIQSIKKPSLRHLVSKMWSPVSADFSLVNLLLEVWYGPSLLPTKFSLKDLVDLAEAVMGILPSNYQLAISVCKLLTRGSNSSNVSSAGVSFWASSLLVNSLFQAVPVAPEFVWVEAAAILHNLTNIRSIKESFHKRAVSVYPFSIKLWKSYMDLSRATGEVSAIIEAARKGGIKLDCYL